MAETAVVTTEEQRTLNEQPAQRGTGRLGQFLHDVRSEMRKVITPSRAEVRSTTIVVIATVFIFAAYFEVVDLVLGKGIDKVLNSFVKH